MKNAYIYPYSSRVKELGLYNPYIDDFVRSVESEFNFINRDKPPKAGVFDLFKYFTKLDYVFFNWIENVPENRGGIIQTYVLYFLIFLFKLKGTKVVWTLHNKFSHKKNLNFFRKQIFHFMLRKADIILTHASEGQKFAEGIKPGLSKKIIFLHHPVKDKRSKSTSKPLYDILIWGTIAPYKGIHTFLEHLQKNNLSEKYRILIVGKIIDADYEKTILKFQSDKIEIKNAFLSDEELVNLINRSKVILFTYSKASILSSGVLMDSLGYGGNVVGPDVGAFSDLKKEGIIKTFISFDDMEQAISAAIETDHNLKEQKLNDFLEKNSWDTFGKTFLNRLKDFG